MRPHDICDGDNFLDFWIVVCVEIAGDADSRGVSTIDEMVLFVFMF